MKKADAIMLNPEDNVVTVVDAAPCGKEVHYFKGSEIHAVVTTEDIPACHKIAIAPIAKGAHIIKYGEIIGAAEQDLTAGCWVSHHNINSLPRDYSNELN